MKVIKIDWKLYTFLFAVITIFFNTVVLVTIKYNDLHHLQETTCKLQQKVEDMGGTVVNLLIEVGKIKVKLEME